ncbi:S8 family serine peptidase [Nonomuraea sp. NPDC005650]|uniref:S8 family peptidase n=1 Tax=Nonomuraea sp. NPDC005650 TaxID=3157045 RepID=UPI0033A6BDCA
MSRTSLRRRLPGLLLTTALLTASLTSTASAEPTPSADPAPSRWTSGTQSTAPRGSWVTLLTGDRVYVEGNRVSIDPAPGREKVGFSQYERDGHQFVVPNDAQKLVSAARLDRRLFDVTGLVQAGYDDAHVDDVPTIVSYEAKAAARVRSAGKVTRTLPSIGAAAVKVGKAKAHEFWTEVTAGPATQRTAASGIGRIWLDGKREVSLDQSVKQIGAPTAWAAGYDGSGITVAVLDTGIDNSHPDLAGKIVEEKNFTDAADTVDNVGHGTHVASTIAGSGSASGGKYRGVAPGANLLIGKVCSTRNCAESAILAGMEWAAERAKVVNMSLGGTDFPGVDVLEEAVNRLTASTGTLFVVAAGNEGRNGGVSSPATADAALAVGAVDKQDALASFSNRGPRVDGAIKPDITGPGVGIVAALAKGSDYPEYSPGYTQLNGTSMATPHVAGAAALLAQQHPKWTGPDLKAALVATAKPNPGLNAFQQGAGRVDVGRAVQQAILPDATGLALGSQPWPAEDDVPVTKTITYRNDGTAPVTLDLTTTATGPDGAAAPAGLFTASPARAVVPAGGTAAVTLTADTRVPSATGTFTGMLLASNADGVSVRTPLTITKGHETRTVTFRLTDRAGAPASDYDLSVVGLDLDVFQVPYDASGTVKAKLRPGRYHVQATVITPDGTSTLLVQPNLTVGNTDDGVLTLDARQGTPVSVTVPKSSARTRLAAAGFFRVLPRGYGLAARIVGADFGKLFTADLGAEVTADQGTLVSEVRSFWAEPGADGTFYGSPYEYDLVQFVRGRFLTGYHHTVRPSELATVVNRNHGVTPDKQQGYMHNFGFPPEGGSAMSGPIRYDVPSTRTIYYSAKGVVWDNRWETSGARQTQFWYDDTTWQPGRKFVVDWQRGPAGPKFNPRTYVARAGNTIMLNIPPFGDDSGHTGYSLLDGGRVGFYRDGVQLVEISKYFYDASGPVPSAESTYRLEYDVDRTTGFNASTKISGAWTFKSGEVSTDKWTYLPLSSFSFTPQVDLANSAPAGRPFRVPVSLKAQPGSVASRTRRVSVEVSYDEGATWRKAALTPTGTDTWLATLNHPDKGSVSVRAHAERADGGTVDYTVIRAYNLR